MIYVYLFYTDASVKTHSYLYIKTSRMHFHLTDFKKLIVKAYSRVFMLVVFQGIVNFLTKPCL